MGATEFVPWTHFDRTIDAVREMKKRGIKTVALETCNESKSYTDYDFSAPVCLVVGNEALGIPQSVLQEVDDVVEIPLYGYKNSLNVATAYGVVLFDIVKGHTAKS